MNRLRTAMRAAGRKLLLATLTKHRWNLTRAGRALGMDRTAVARAVYQLMLHDERAAAVARGDLRIGGQR